MALAQMAPPGFGIVGEISEPRVRCAYEAMHVRWARVIFRWPDIEPAPGVFNWNKPDNIVRAGKELGYQLLVTLEDSPPWANGGKPPGFPPENIEAWKQFVRKVVRRYSRFDSSGYGVHYWAIWNEPNLPIFFRGNMQDYIERIFIPAAEIIHAIDPRNRVVGPEFSWHWVLPPGNWSLFDFLGSPAGDALDVLSLHIWNDAPDGFEGFLDQVIFPLLQTTGWLGRPFWVTETGYPTCGGICADDAQLHFLLRVISAQQRRSSWLQRVFFFSVFFNQPCETLVKQDFTCQNWSVRPAFTAFLNFINNLPIEEFAPQCHLASSCQTKSAIPPFFQQIPVPDPLRRTAPDFRQCGRP